MNTIIVDICEICEINPVKSLYSTVCGSCYSEARMLAKHDLLEGRMSKVRRRLQKLERMQAYIERCRRGDEADQGN